MWRFLLVLSLLWVYSTCPKNLNGPNPSVGWRPKYLATLDLRENIYPASLLVKLEYTREGRNFIWFLVCLVQNEGMDQGIKLLEKLLKEVDDGKSILPSLPFLRKTFKDIENRYNVPVERSTRWENLLVKPTLSQLDDL